MIILKELELTWEGAGILITGFLAILSGVGNIIQFYLGRKELKKNRNVQYVTDKRVEWIYAVRQEASNFLALLYTVKASTEISEEI